MVVLTEISQESSSSSSTYDYDVFLSFRGTETRYNFTDHLHKALVEASVDTFLDDAEIQTGEILKPELESAIKASRASIIVLSEDYASSTWCLDELVLIIEQRMTSKHIVFPIFYNVKPTDVRKQQNSFGESMAKHKQRIGAEQNAAKRSQLVGKMKQWERALTEVADIKGEEANGSRRETILIEGIVKEISCRLDLQKRSKIPHLIGMESSITTITSFMKDESSHTGGLLTVWGMAGIGKTYLADYIFKLHHLDFERSCFLEDIERRCKTPNGLLDLQKQLLKGIREISWMDIDNTDVATFQIEKSLLRKKVFIVLDGIDKFEQLDALIGTKGLHPGSKIIITSKNGSLTKKCMLFETEAPPIHKKLLLEGLNEKESLQLLSRHAFGCNDPKQGTEEEPMKVVKYCQGHPLALKVLGSSIRNKDATWEDILESLGKEVNPDIQKVLQISFDSLPHEKDKELFKYIACFFVREDREFTENILKACGICRSFGIKNLTERCLLTVESSNKLEMHQLLQDMGRDIVHQESPKKPWKRSLLWHHEECLDVLRNRKGTTKIQGLVLDMKPFVRETSSRAFRSFPLLDWIHILLSVIWWLYGWILRLCSSFHRQKGGIETHTFSKMCNLRILRLNYVQLDISYKNFPEGVRWLCMHGFPLSCIPSDIQMDNLVALDMSYSNLHHIWKKPKLLKSLKFLNLSCCRELVSVGHLSGLPLLETLMLVGCVSLIEICESIGNCDRLVVLDMSRCNKLKKLPSSIGKLKKLKKLSINGCSELDEFPCGIKDMDLLEVLEANNLNIQYPVYSCYSPVVEAIPRIPKSYVISLPSSLVKLSLINNNLYNESFPLDLSSLSMLTELYLDKNPIDSLPAFVVRLTRLEFLSLEYCYRLKTILCAPKTVNSLVAYECLSLEKISFHPEKSALPDVYYAETYSLNEIQNKFKLQAISETDEEILRSLGWNNIEYMRYHKLSIAGFGGLYRYMGRKLPAQMLYEHGIFSTYLRGQEVPKWFTHRSNDSSFILQSSQKNCKIRGLNVCIVSSISSTMEVGPLRLTIRNLSKNSSWIYQPLTYVIPEANEQVIVWLSHWMFENNEFEDGDEVRVHVSVNFFHEGDTKYTRYGGKGPDYAHVTEYGINLVYNDENKKEDPLAYYKSWNHIIGRDISAAKRYSGDYLLQPDWPYIGYTHYHE